MYLKDSTQYTLPQIRKAHPQVSIPDGADLTDLGYYLIEVIEPPTVTANQRLTKGDPEEYEPGHWRETWIVTDIPLSEVKAQRINELASLRYQHETAGITLNGATIKTDRESQALITGAYAYSQLDPAALIDWKATTGWIQIDATAIAGIATAVACHVQDCFSNERTLSEAIAAAESVDAVQQIDLTIGWP
jgi:hypothetical protein